MFFTLSPLIIIGQDNLVPNPGFEERTGCPTSISQMHKVNYWFSSRYPDNSEEYYHACCQTLPYYTYGIPKNGIGEQWPHSDSGYVGFIFYCRDIIHSYFNYREYIQVKLTDTLKKGCQYCVSFFVSPADNANLGIRQIGALLAPDTILNMDTPQALTPQIEYSGSPITDTLAWTEVSGSFIARGDESYIMLGNFNYDLKLFTI